MEQIKNTIIGENILNNFWLKILLDITLISNFLSNFLLNCLSFYEILTGLFL